MSPGPGSGGPPEVLRVALAKQGEDQPSNVLLLAHVDLVIPVEIDQDRDAKRDDVRLTGYGGTYEKVISVRNDEGSPHWREHTFPDVRFGAYQVAVKVGNDWVEVGEVVYRKKGAFVGARKLGKKPPSRSAQPPAPAAAPAPPPAPPPPADPAHPEPYDQPD